MSRPDPFGWITGELVRSGMAQLDEHMIHGPTISGRFSSNHPNIEERKPMKDHTVKIIILDPFTRTVEGLEDLAIPDFDHADKPELVRELSSVIFNTYYTGDKPHVTSPVSDRIASHILENPSVFLEMMDLVAEYNGATDDVTGMVIGNPESGEPFHIMSLVDTAFGDDYQLPPLLDGDGEFDFTALWENVWQFMGGDEADVTFDRSYVRVGPDPLNYAPAIHGEGVVPMTVNGAILQVMADHGLDTNNHYLRLALSARATHMDSSGWVYCGNDS